MAVSLVIATYPALGCPRCANILCETFDYPIGTLTVVSTQKSRRSGALLFHWDCFTCYCTSCRGNDDAVYGVSDNVFLINQ